MTDQPKPVLRVEIQREVIEARVSSETHKGAFYLVRKNGGYWFCSCPAHTYRDRILELEQDCKHIFALKQKLHII